MTTTESNYSVERVPVRDAAGRIKGWANEQRFDAPKAEFLTAADLPSRPHAARRDQWTGAAIYDPPSPADGQSAPPVEQRGIRLGGQHSPPSAPELRRPQTRSEQRDQLFARKATFGDLIDLATDPVVGGAVLEMVNRDGAERFAAFQGSHPDTRSDEQVAIDLAMAYEGAEPANALLDDWAERHVDLTRPAEPAIDLAGEAPRVRLALQAVTAFSDGF